MVAHRIADPIILRLISKWLKAGALRDGVFIAAEQGMLCVSVSIRAMRAPAECDRSGAPSGELFALKGGDLPILSVP
jgi:hypothetical protein